MHYISSTQSISFAILFRFSDYTTSTLHLPPKTHPLFRQFEEDATANVLYLGIKKKSCEHKGIQRIDHTPIDDNDDCIDLDKSYDSDLSKCPIA